MKKPNSIQGVGFHNGGFEHLLVNGRKYSIDEVCAALGEARRDNVKYTFRMRIFYQSGTTGEVGRQSYDTLKAEALFRLNSPIQKVNIIDLLRITTSERKIETLRKENV
jgi:hypothetical protein